MIRIGSKCGKEQAITVEDWLQKLPSPEEFYEDRGEFIVNALTQSDTPATICDWRKFDFVRLGSKDWSRVLCLLPELADKCPCWESFNAVEWCFMLRRQPQFADRCMCWTEIEGDIRLIIYLARRQPHFLDRFPQWSDKLQADPCLWACLLADQPKFAEQCPWQDMDGFFWARLLGSRPEFVDRCPWEKLDGSNWSLLLAVRPEFAGRCAWEKLGGYDWHKLLLSQPQFAGWCDWAKLDDREWYWLLSTRPEFADRCPCWKSFSRMEQWTLLQKSEKFCGLVDWENLTLGEKVDHLLLRPEFADQMPWAELGELDKFRILAVHPGLTKGTTWNNPMPKVRDHGYVVFGKARLIVLLPLCDAPRISDYKDDYPQMSRICLCDHWIRTGNNIKKVGGSPSSQDTIMAIEEILHAAQDEALALDGEPVGDTQEERDKCGVVNFYTILKDRLEVADTCLKLLCLEYGSHIEYNGVDFTC